MTASKPPAPQPTPDPKPVIDQEAEAGRAAYAARLKRMRGRASTMLAGASDLTPSSGGSATLGGA